MKINALVINFILSMLAFFGGVLFLSFMCNSVDILIEGHMEFIGLVTLLFTVWLILLSYLALMLRN